MNSIFLNKDSTLLVTMPIYYKEGEPEFIAGVGQVLTVDYNHLKNITINNDTIGAKGCMSIFIHHTSEIFKAVIVHGPEVAKDEDCCNYYKNSKNDILHFYYEELNKLFNIVGSGLNEASLTGEVKFDNIHEFAVDLAS